MRAGDSAGLRCRPEDWIVETCDTVWDETYQVWLTKLSLRCLICGLPSVEEREPRSFAPHAAEPVIEAARVSAARCRPRRQAFPEMTHPTQFDRVRRALLSNMRDWMESVEEIAQDAHPGNKSRALHLLRNMKQAELTIRRMLGRDDEAPD
jgi:hypothetical protein